MKAINYDREVWEGWTVRDFIQHLYDTGEVDVIARRIRSGRITTKKELTDAVRDCQPYIKKRIPEVDAYFQDYFAPLLAQGGNGGGYGWQL